MPGIASNRVAPPLYQRQLKTRPRSEDKRSRIVEAATKHFAEHGYHDARVGDIASALGIAKGSIFQHFGSKDGLFFEVYKRAVRSFAEYLDAPADVQPGRISEVLRYWLSSHRASCTRRLDSLPDLAARQLRYRSRFEARDQPFFA